jgi:uncharacterized protein YfiM (DUF2279 family)
MAPCGTVPMGEERCYDASVRRLLLIVLLLQLLTTRVAAADAWWGADKAYHLSLSFAFAGTCYAALALLSSDRQLVRLGLSASLALAPGVAKEIYDSGRPGNGFSGRDLTWDIVGVVAGSLAGLGVELLVRRLRARPAARRVELDVGHAGAQVGIIF